jgi:hypothetical protein
MNKAKFTAVLLSIIIIPSAIYAQDRPFLFTYTPENYMTNQAFLRYEAAYGEKTFEPIGVDDFEQNVGLQASLGKYFMVLDHTGLAFTHSTTKLSQQTEVLGNILNTNNNETIDFSAGAGFLHEYDGTNVLISRVIIGRHFSSSELYGNLLFEHAFSSDRDPVDMMTSIGYSYKLMSDLNIGVEAVGQDLEGFWDTEEAEGGATVYLGPDLNFEISEIPLNVTVGGGEIIHATHSSRTSEAMRALPIVSGNGFIFRSVISLGL